MNLYCMCEAQAGTKGAGKPDAQVFGAKNRYCGLRELAPPAHPVADAYDEKFPPLALRQPMVCIVQGVAQVILRDHKPNMWEGGPRPTDYDRHYPNVDVYECPNCKARVVLE